MKAKAESFIPLIKIRERERLAGGIGVLDASGAEAGGRIASLDETPEEVIVTFSYYGSLKPRLHIGMGEEVKYQKTPPFALRRIQVECLVLEESPESLMILFPDPKKIAKEVREKAGMK